MSYTVPDFAHAHKDLLVIVCDPKTDNIFVGYGDQIVSGRIKTALGKELNVVRNVLDHSQFKENVNPFITGIMEVLQLPLKAGNQLYQFIDGALFAISKALRKDKPPENGVASPYHKALVNNE